MEEGRRKKKGEEEPWRIRSHGGGEEEEEDPWRRGKLGGGG